MTESYGTSHSLIVWTQEANWSYRGQTHKAVLAVGWRGMRKCMCVCVQGMCVEVGGRWWEALPPILLLLKSSHERPCQELQCGLSRPSQRQSRLHDAATLSHTADLRSYCSCCRLGYRAKGAGQSVRRNARREESKRKVEGKKTKGRLKWSLREEPREGPERLRMKWRVQWQEYALMIGVSLLTNHEWVQLEVSGRVTPILQKGLLTRKLNLGSFGESWSGAKASIPSLRTYFYHPRRIPVSFPGKVRHITIQSHLNWTVTWQLHILNSARLSDHRWRDDS